MADKGDKINPKKLEEKGERSKNDFPARNNIPIPYIEDFSDISMWIECIRAWSAATDLPEEKQGFALAQEIPKESSRYGATLREDLYKEVKPTTLINNAEGVELIIKFMEERFWKNTDEEIYSTYAEMKVIQRRKDQSIPEYIIEYDKMLQKAKQLKINNPNDRVLAMDLLITANLTETEFMLIKTVADVQTDDKKRYQTVKQKMREIFGKIDNKTKNNEAFLNNSDNKDNILNHDELYLSRGWKPPKKDRQYQKPENRYQKQDNNKNSSTKHSRHENKSFFRTKKQNPLGKDGKPLQCNACKATTHFAVDCPDAIQNTGNYKKFKTALVLNAATKEEEKVLIPILSDTESSEESQEECNLCSTYCTDNIDDLNEFTAEALNKGALDTCCSSSVCGENWLRIYLQALPKEMKGKVEGPMNTNKQFIFGNQGKLKAIAKYNIPVHIGGEDNQIRIDVISSDIPLLLSKSDMKDLGIVLDMKNDRGYINGKPLILTTSAAGHYTVDLLHNKEKLEQVNITELDEDNTETKMEDKEDTEKISIKTRRQGKELEDFQETDWTSLKMDDNNEKDTGEVIEEDNENVIPGADTEEKASNNPPTSNTGVTQDAGRKRKKTHQRPEPEFNEDGSLANAATVLKKNDRIEILENGKWEKGIVLGHGGKVGGKHAGWYSIQLDNGQVFHDEMSRREVRYNKTQEEDDEAHLILQLDNGKLIEVNQSKDNKIRMESEEEVFALLVHEAILAVMLSREQRNSPAALAAKLVELDNLKAFNTYEVVNVKGQDRITTTWVLMDKDDEIQAKKVANKLKKFEVTMTTSDIDNFSDCQVWIFNDAAVRNLNNNTDSCGGYFLLLVNTKIGNCAPEEWKSGKIKRKENSTLGAETLSLYNGLDAALDIKELLKQITNGEADLTIKAITDNNSTRVAVYSESEMTGRLLRAEFQGSYLERL